MLCSGDLCWCSRLTRTLYVLIDLLMDPPEHNGNGPPPEQEGNVAHPEGNGNGAQPEHDGGNVAPPVPSTITPLKADPEPVSKKVLRIPMARRGFGTSGNRVPVLTNHFKVNVASVDGHFFHYSVCTIAGKLSLLMLLKAYDCSV